MLGKAYDVPSSVRARVLFNSQDVRLCRAAVGKDPHARDAEDLQGLYPHGMLTIRADVLNPGILAFIDGARSGAKESRLHQSGASGQV